VYNIPKKRQSKCYAWNSLSHSQVIIPFKRRSSLIMAPRQVGEYAFVWDELHLGPSRQSGAGLGVFASSNLTPGTMVPILGMPLTESDIHALQRQSKLTHAWTATNLACIDGHPKHYPHGNVGCFGLAIVMMICEPNKKAPNCIFKKDYLVISSRIKAKQELLVFYGARYESIRIERGYSLHENSHFNSMVECTYPGLEKAICPSVGKRRRVFFKWMQIISNLISKVYIYSSHTLRHNHRIASQSPYITHSIFILFR
jgi:hypothetical protein